VAHNTAIGWDRRTLAERPEPFFLYSQIASLHLPFNSTTTIDDSMKIHAALVAA